VVTMVKRMDVPQMECVFDGVLVAAFNATSEARVDVECTVILLETLPQGLMPSFGCLNIRHN
jgi:hypothetical protein